MEILYPVTYSSSARYYILYLRITTFACFLGAPFGRVAFLKSPNSAEPEFGSIYDSGTFLEKKILIFGKKKLLKNNWISDISM